MRTIFVAHCPVAAAGARTTPSMAAAMPKRITPHKLLRIWELHFTNVPSAPRPHFDDTNFGKGAFHLQL